MTTKIKFGWRVPDFPLDGSKPAIFRDQMLASLDPLQESFDSFWVADHFIPWFAKMDPKTDTYEAWTTLTYLSARFPRLWAGNLVICQSYRPPALLAKMAATLQVLTNGHYILGIGAGWKKDEYLAYGYDFPAPAIRIHQLNEAVQIIRKMWTQPETTFKGQYYQVEKAICEPKPNPLPPIMIGGGGKQLTLRVVAEQADWWNMPGISPEHYEELLGILRQHCQAAGRKFDAIVKTVATDCVAVAATHQKAQALADASPFGRDEGAIIGTPDEVSAQLERYTRLGVTHFVLRFADFPDTAAASLFAKEVIHRFAA